MEKDGSMEEDGNMEYMEYGSLQEDGSTSNVKPTFFQDRLLSFSYKRPPKNRIYSFLKQNSLSEQNVLFQISKFLVQKQLVCSFSKFFLRLQKVLFCF